MLLSLSVRATGCALLLQAATALAAEPSVQPWAQPLDSTALSAVTADRGLAAVLSLPVPAETNRHASRIVEIAKIDLPRPSADAWTPLGELAQPAPRDFPGTSQTAVNLALSVTLDGVAAFASVRQ